MNTYYNTNYIKELSERELQILKYICFGLTNYEIAKKLNISYHTVKVYIAALIKKYNKRNRTSLAYFAGKYIIKTNCKYL